ncbi:glycosyltransferase [Cohnella hashimotonis]|uniref:Glycosyltransferase n=1 Tax=Cohnella hashimotonis TaxID=2826895 RepID=A0ABT6TPF0_9BACL|nr:glycosyltransferase [Cohnella hashimotonis]MDI4648614.1 glycosyltransferase [Cohnella hashimotonis]
MTLRNILIYRDCLLAPSETFIRSQAEGMRIYRAHYAGSNRNPGISLDPERVTVLNSGGAGGRMRELLFKSTGLGFPIERKFRQMHFRLLHAHFGPDAALALPIARRLHIPLVVTFHGYDATIKDEYARKSYYTHRNYIRKREQLQRSAALFIAVSDFIRGKLIEQGYPADKIVRHYIGVDTVRFKPEPEHASPRENVVLFVGRLVEVKGAAYLIQAMSQVQRENPDAELVLIGDGPLRAELEELAARTLKKYRFLGTQPPEVVKRWMNRAKVFSVPSVPTETGAEEAFGISFLEAASMRLPVASFRTGGIPEAVSDGETGLLAEPRDWQGLAACISRLLSDEALWRRLSARSRERVRESFDLTEQTKKLEEIYHSVLAGDTSQATGYQLRPSRIDA